MNQEAGKLDTPVVLLKPTSGRDAFGNLGEVNTTTFDVWAQRIDPRGNEVTSTRGETAPTLVIFRIRWRIGVGTDWTLRDKETDALFDIQHVAPRGRRRYLDLQCKAREVVAPGA